MSTNEMIELANQLHKLAHKYGYEDFADAVAQAAFFASDDTECFEDKSITQKYRYLANAICDARIDEPEFSNESYYDSERMR